jgi:hypothetical protein
MPDYGTAYTLMAHPFETFEDLALAAAGVRGTTFLKPLAPPQPHAPPHGRRTAYLRYVRLREPDRLHTVTGLTHTAPTGTAPQLGTPSAAGQRGAGRRGPGGYEGGYTLYTRDIRCKICPTLRVHLIHRSSSPHSTVNTYGFGPSSRKRVWGVTSKPRPHRTAGSIPRCTTGR